MNSFGENASAAFGHFFANLFTLLGAGLVFGLLMFGVNYIVHDFSNRAGSQYTQEIQDTMKGTEVSDSDATYYQVDTDFNMRQVFAYYGLIDMPEGQELTLQQKIFISMLPILIVGYILSVIVKYWSYVFGIVQGATEESLVTSLMDSLRYFTRFFGVTLLVLWRSWAWLVLVGYLLVIIFNTDTGALVVGSNLQTVGLAVVLAGALMSMVKFPQYLAAPVLLVQNDLTITESVKTSEMLSKSSYGSIITQLFLFGFAFAIVSLIAVSIFGFVSLLLRSLLVAIPFGSTIFAIAISATAFAWGLIPTFFVVKMSESLAADFINQSTPDAPHQIRM